MTLMATEMTSEFFTFITYNSREREKKNIAYIFVVSPSFVPTLLLRLFGYYDIFPRERKAELMLKRTIDTGAPRTVSSDSKLSKEQERKSKNRRGSLVERKVSSLPFA